MISGRQGKHNSSGMESRFGPAFARLILEAVPMKSEVTFAGVLLVAMVVAAPAGATQGRGQAKKAEKAEAHQKADGVHHGEDDTACSTVTATSG